MIEHDDDEFNAANIRKSITAEKAKQDAEETFLKDYGITQGQYWMFFNRIRSEVLAGATPKNLACEVDVSLSNAFENTPYLHNEKYRLEMSTIFFEKIHPLTKLFTEAFKKLGFEVRVYPKKVSWDCAYKKTIYELNDIHVVVSWK